MKQINLRVDDRLLEGIDRARGPVPRNTWIRYALWNAIEADQGKVSEQGPLSTRAVSARTTRPPTQDPPAPPPETRSEAFRRATQRV